MSRVSALRRIGHKGADLIVPGNTPASFDAALAHGVDMIEFDILEHEGELLLAHDFEHVEGAPTLEEGLAHLASAPFAGVELDVDLKLHGYEERAVEALRRHGLIERTLVSTMWMRSLIVLRELEPQLRLGWSVPRLKNDPTQSWLTKLPAYAGAAYVRGKLPSAARRHIAEGRMRRRDGALAARHAAAGARDQGGRRRALRVDGRRRPADQAGSRSSASPGSSPTTRACSDS